MLFQVMLFPLGAITFAPRISVEKHHLGRSIPCASTSLCPSPSPHLTGSPNSFLLS
ncbi:MAG: hypothetical protein NTY83_02650 [Candidatus Micrarchaeota archaeon]|nr:hypothetical protein [Candidatus Micrarchaeota archaeon]